MAAVKIIPDERPNAPSYLMPDDGPIGANDKPLGPNDREPRALQEKCRQKVRALMASVRDGDNERASLVETASNYRNLFDQKSPDILVSSLWSAANTLRPRHEAHCSAINQGRLNDELPPLTAATLKDLLEPHGIFSLSHLGASEVERKMREYLNGPRDPEAQKVDDRIADTRTSATTVLIAEAAVPLSLLDQDAAKGEGPSAQIAEVSLQNRIKISLVRLLGRSGRFNRRRL
ncbi:MULTISPECIES: hypothetical protein [Falsihalocynthiibacter]|uniref:hypothetical protein n=1 Tax=Falsihalocynthiibacter TaxID=2854182 RepID=UPI00300210B4